MAGMVHNTLTGNKHKEHSQHLKDTVVGEMHTVTHDEKSRVSSSIVLL